MLLSHSNWAFLYFDVFVFLSFFLLKYPQGPYTTPTFPCQDKLNCQTIFPLGSKNIENNKKEVPLKKKKKIKHEIVLKHLK